MKEKDKKKKDNDPRKIWLVKISKQKSKDQQRKVTSCIIVEGNQRAKCPGTMVAYTHCRIQKQKSGKAMNSILGKRAALYNECYHSTNTHALTNPIIKRNEDRAHNTTRRSRPGPDG